MDAWTVIRYLHLLAMALFVGGQMVLAVAVVPSLRGREQNPAMRAVVRRFGVASAIALVTLIGTGTAMAGHFVRWDDPTLHVKLGLLGLVGVLLGLHIAAPRTRAISLAVLVTSLAIVWLGVRLAHG